MQVSNQMLSLTGSLLADPANPPPPSEPTILIRDPSPSPEPLEVEPPEEQPRHSNPKPITKGHATYDTELQPRPEAAVRHEVIDERFLSARELKKRRKDETKDKREERKAKKGEVILDAVETVGGGVLVGLRGSGGEKVVKRKADGDSGEMRKKRRDKP